jgi:hypothetical protein
MKKLCLILIASFALVTVLELNKVYAEEGGGIPLSQLAGGFASTVQGSLSICLNPMSVVEKPCATGGAVVVTFTALSVGKLTLDKKGNVCDTETRVLSNLPLDASPPLGTAFNIAAKTVNYDPANGVGDWPFTGYSGGKCNGALFDSTGATVVATGNAHIVAFGRRETY